MVACSWTFYGKSNGKALAFSGFVAAVLFRLDVIDLDMLE